jgi:hypothetical protein
MPRPDSDGRRWPPHTIGVAILVAALLAWYGTAMAVGLRPAGPPASRAADLVPGDGSRQQVTFTQGGTSSRAMTENARITGVGDLSRGMSVTAYYKVDLPAGDPQTTRWWREAVIPGDLQAPSRYRIRAVTAAGVWLAVQDWDTAGLSFEHFLELPADVHPGASWTSSGKAVGYPSDTSLTFRNSSAAAAPADPARAAQGCLSVTSSTELTAVSPAGDTTRMQETNQWCPGLGVVAETGTLRAAGYQIAADPAPVMGFTAEDLQPSPFDPQGLDHWTVRPTTLLSGDATFGGEQADLLVDRPILMTSSGDLVFPYGDGADLTAVTPLDSGDLYWHWWVRPGGTVVSTAVAGAAVLATTTDRQLVAYAAGGRLRWTASLDELALAPPLVIGDDRVALATLAGTVSLYDLTDGRRIWSRQLSRAVRTPLASNGSVLAVADDGPTLTVLDIASGRELWQADEGSQFGSSLAVGGREVVLQAGRTGYGYDLATGRQRWVRPSPIGLRAIARHGDLLWVDTDRGLEAWAPDTGLTVWAIPGGQGPTSAGAGCTRARSAAGATPSVGFVLRGEQLLAVAPDGAIQKSWTITAPGSAERLVHCSAGRVWVTASAIDGSSPLSVESVGPA